MKNYTNLGPSCQNMVWTFNFFWNVAFEIIKWNGKISKGLKFQYLWQPEAKSYTLCRTPPEPKDLIQKTRFETGRLDTSLFIFRGKRCYRVIKWTVRILAQNSFCLIISENWSHFWEIINERVQVQVFWKFSNALGTKSIWDSNPRNTHFSNSICCLFVLEGESDSANWRKIPFWDIAPPSKTFLL